MIDEHGQVEILSTHEQELEGQVYLGCRFPSDKKYRHLLHQFGRSVGQRLSQLGARGRYGVDFLFLPHSSGSNSTPSSCLSATVRGTVENRVENDEDGTNRKSDGNEMEEGYLFALEIK